MEEDISADESEGPASFHVRQDRLNEKLFMHCGAQVLAFVFVLLVYGAWNLLQDYRDAILWAVLCSVTLRDLKSHLAVQALMALDTERSLCSLGRAAVYYPLVTIQEAVLDIWGFFQRWRSYAVAYEKERKERIHDQNASASDGIKSEAKERSSHADEKEGEGGGRDASETLRKRKKSVKKRKRKPAVAGLFSGFFRIGQLGIQAYKGGRRKKPKEVSGMEGKEHQSFPLLSSLLIAVAAYQGFCFLSSWSGALRVVLLSSSVLSSLIAIPFCYLVAHLILSESKPEKQKQTSPKGAENEPSGSAAGPPSTASPAVPAASPLEHSRPIKPIYRAYRKMDHRLNRMIASSIHSLVAAGLVVALVLCSSCLLIFLSVQIGQESTAAVKAVHEAARTWASIDVQTSPPTATSGAVGRWVLGQQASMGRLLQESLPAAAEWAETRVNTAIEAHNLTKVRDDMKALYLSVLPARSCSQDQKQQYLITLARASLDAQKASEEHDAISLQIEEVRDSFAHALDDLESKCSALGELEDAREAEEVVVEIDARLRHLQSLHLPAHRARDETAEKHKIAQENVSRCQKLQRKPGADGIDRLQQLASQMQAACNQFWKLQVGDGLDTLQEVWAQVVNVSSDAWVGKNDQLGVNLLQRVAQVAADPLVALSQTMAAFLASTTYSTTVMALTGGLGIFRLGLGILKSVVQMVVFLALLFYLLAAEYDPVAGIFQILPLPHGTRLRISKSIEQSMREILVCTAKLAFFHALFTWLTFRIFEVHLVYLSALASAIFASIPFIPSWLISLPAAAQLVFIQDRPMAAIMLLAAHFLAWYLAADTIFREIDSTHPYLTGLGIFGGIATFSNPLQGAIFGPMALSILSLAYNLHLSLVAEEHSISVSKSTRSSASHLLEARDSNVLQNQRLLE